eukprot:SAG31_NODE_876_length_11307_cov_3.506781_7_plen_52_part_00
MARATARPPPLCGGRTAQLLLLVRLLSTSVAPEAETEVRCPGLKFGTPAPL